jgi:IS5 family transposase
MLRLCLLQYIYGDSDRQVVENARINLAYKFFLGLAVDEEPPDDTTVSYFRAIRLGEDKFRQVFQNIVQQCIDKGLVKGKRQMIDSTHIVAVGWVQPTNSPLYLQHTWEACGTMATCYNVGGVLMWKDETHHNRNYA